MLYTVKTTKGNAYQIVANFEVEAKGLATNWYLKDGEKITEVIPPKTEDTKRG